MARPLAADGGVFANRAAAGPCVGSAVAPTRFETARRATQARLLAGLARRSRFLARSGSRLHHGGAAHAERLAATSGTYRGTHRFLRRDAGGRSCAIDRVGHWGR